MNQPVFLTLQLLGILFITVTVHELAHYFACRHYGILRGYGIWKGNPTIDNSDYNAVVVLVGFLSSIPMYPLMWLVPIYGWRVPFSYWIIYWAIASGYDLYQFFKHSILGIPYMDETYPVGELGGWWLYIPYKEGGLSLFKEPHHPVRQYGGQME
ncbi:MAG: hypothetical protein ACTSPB_01230 [Candidatus Thorarchaeota archaeon]